MLILDPIPLRACSTCRNWYASNGTPNETGVISALCCVQNERKTGSDKCSKWQKRLEMAR